MRHQNGFTLIELLVVTTTISVLAAIALPQYSQYRQRAFDARSLTNLSNAAISEEAYFQENERYIDCADGADCEAKLPAFEWSSGVSIQMTRVAAAGEDSEHFIGRAFHPLGRMNNPATAYLWDNSAGGLQ